MTVQQQQVRKTNQTQAKVVYLVFSNDLTKTFNLCGKGCNDLPLQKVSFIRHMLRIPHIPLLFYSNSISEAGIYLKLRA